MTEVVMISQEPPINSPAIILPTASALSHVSETPLMFEHLSDTPSSPHPALASEPEEDQSTHIEELKATVGNLEGYMEKVVDYKARFSGYDPEAGYVSIETIIFIFCSIWALTSTTGGS
eukprot:c47852_g1_i1 orf=262-618(+)